MPLPLIFLSKSTWIPPIRREHALAEMAAASGNPVLFVERPRDVRSLVPLRSRRHPAPATHGRAAGIEVLPRMTPVPGHLGSAAQALDATLLRWTLQHRAERLTGTVVATVPWQWPAVMGIRAARRVFDCADDWSRILARRRRDFTAIYRRVGSEADAVIVASEDLAALFSPAAVTVVRNGSAPEVLEPPIQPPTTSRTMVYAGTLSERFDAPLMARVLQLLADWTLELYGQCQYRRHGDEPSAELMQLLSSSDGRATWHGFVSRASLAGALDRGTVLVVPHRRIGAVTGDSMKLYDYAARGRATVTTSWADGLSEVGYPHLSIAENASEFAEAVLLAAGEPADWARARREWAKAQSWEQRWGEWSAVAFASNLPPGTAG